jgi:hypothetical protein
VCLLCSTDLSTILGIALIGVDGSHEMHADASIGGLPLGHAPKEFHLPSPWLRLHVDYLALAFEFLSSSSLSCHTFKVENVAHYFFHSRKTARRTTADSSIPSFATRNSMQERLAWNAFHYDYRPTYEYTTLQHTHYWNPSAPLWY